MSLVGLAELADLFGVTKQVMSNWRSRKANFPTPIAELKSGPVWDISAIRTWATSENLPLYEIGGSDSAVSETGQVRRAVVAAMMNMKGGVGKSTLTANLGWYCAHKHDYRVLLIDLDPQFNLSQYILGIKGYEALLDAGTPTIDSLFKASDDVSVRSIVQNVQSWWDGSCLHIMPARLDLAWAIRNAPASANLLHDNLEDLKNEYDLILIDCAPTDSVLSDAAYMAADYMFVPVKPEFLSTIGVPLLLESQRVFSNKNPSRPLPTFGGIIFNDASEKVEHDRARAYVRRIAIENDLYVFANELSHSDSYPVGSRVGKPIFLTDNARTVKKDEFSRVAEEFISRMGL